KGELPQSGGVPCLKLLPPQLGQTLPAKGMAVDDDGVWLGHGVTRSRGCKSWLASSSGLPCSASKCSRARRRVLSIGSSPSSREADRCKRSATKSAISLLLAS